MPRIRTLKPEFFRSPSTASVEPLCRIFYQALWCWADDFGIGETNIYGLLGFAFPDDDPIYDETLRGFRAVSAQDVRRFCADVAQHFGVTFYIVHGRHYYSVPTWDQHQKTERRSERRKNPTPDDPEAVPDMQFQSRAESAPQMPRRNGADSRENSAGTGEQGNRLKEREIGARDELAHRLTFIPDDWEPSLTHHAKAKSLGIEDIGSAAEAFRNHALSEARQSANWDAAFASWLASPRTRATERDRNATKPQSKLRAAAELAQRMRDEEAQAQRKELA